MDNRIRIFQVGGIGGIGRPAEREHGLRRGARHYYVGPADRETPPQNRARRPTRNRGSYGAGQDYGDESGRGQQHQQQRPGHPRRRHARPHLPAGQHQPGGVGLGVPTSQRHSGSCGGGAAAAAGGQTAVRDTAPGGGTPLGQTRRAGREGEQSTAVAFAEWVTADAPVTGVAESVARGGTTS